MQEGGKGMFQLNKQKMLFEMPDNKAIITSRENGVYLESNALGSYVINQINNGAAVDDILMQIMDCEGCPNDISDKMERFIQQLLQLKIIYPIGAKSLVNAKPVNAEALENGFELVVMQL